MSTDHRKAIEWGNLNFSASGMSRRRLLRTLGAGAISAAVGLRFVGGCASSAKPGPSAASPAPLAEGRITRSVPVVAREFSLKEVCLLDGPFKRAQQLDEKYLLSLEPDRMLHNFRVNAGLEPKAPIYGGWESERTWANIRCHGHTLGHYLSACSLMYASTGDDKFKQRVTYIVAELRECQEAGKTGLVNAFPDNATQFNNMAAGRQIVGVPWYTMHKIFAGLRDAHLHCEDAEALAVLVKLSDWAVTTMEPLTDQQFERMLRVEHGGMNEVLADVYVLTGNPKYLALSERFCHKTVLEPLSQSRDTLDGLHSNTQIPKFIGFSRLYGLTGKPQYQQASQFFWKTIVDNRTFATGGNGDQEHFFPPADFAKRLGSAKTMETCCSHNMLKLTRSLFELEPSASYADYYERTLFNAILGSQDPDSGMMTYFQPTRPGYMKLYCTPTDSFWCCTGSGIENHAKYGDSIYFKKPGALYVNLFIASTVDWKEQGVTITQSTQFPQEAGTKLQIKAARPARFVMNIRHPAWCANVTIKLNGNALVTSSTPGSYIPLDRTWRNGDALEIELPMTLRTEPLPGNADTVAFVYGPIVLAGKLGNKGIAPGADIIINERTYGDVLNDPIEVPVLSGEPSTIVASIVPTPGVPLTFTTSKIGRPNDVTLVPYYQIAHERYSMYWKIVKDA